MVNKDTYDPNFDDRSYRLALNNKINHYYVRFDERDLINMCNYLKKRNQRLYLKIKGLLLQVGDGEGNNPLFDIL